MSDYNYGPLEHGLAGGEFGEEDEMTTKPTGYPVIDGILESIAPHEAHNLKRGVIVICANCRKAEPELPEHCTPLPFEQRMSAAEINWVEQSLPIPRMTQSAAEEWRVSGKQTVHVINSRYIATARDEVTAAQIVSDHALAALVPELVEALRQVRAAFFVDAGSGGYVEKGKFIPLDDNQHPWIPGARAPKVIEIIDAALNTLSKGSVQK